MLALTELQNKDDLSFFGRPETEVRGSPTVRRLLQPALFTLALLTMLGFSNPKITFHRPTLAPDESIDPCPSIHSSISPDSKIAIKLLAANK